MMVREKEYVSISLNLVEAFTRYAQIEGERQISRLTGHDESQDTLVEVSAAYRKLEDTITDMQCSADVIWDFGQSETRDGVWDETTPVACDIASRWIETYRTALSLYMAKAEKEPMPENGSQEDLDAYFYRRFTVSREWNGELFALMAALPKQYRRSGWWLREA